MSEADDIQLLRDFAERQSDDAFGKLVRRHVNLVYSVALRQTGNPHAAEEITQAVFIILARKAASLGPKTLLSGWLYQTARLTAANFLRGQIRRQQREQEAHMQSLVNEPQSDEAWQQIAPLLEAAMDSLGERDRNAVVLRYLDGKSLNEVGASLGVSEDAAKMRVNRALEKLRKIFTKRGVTLTAALIAGAVSANSVQAAPVGLTVSVVAAAKGSLATASTLGLVKGVLNVMAWIKAKTAIGVGVGVLLAAGTTTVVVNKIISNSIYEELWRHPDASSRDALEKAPPVLLIRPTRYPSAGNGFFSPSGKAVLVNVNTLSLVNFAYNVLQTRMVLPKGLPDERYDNLPGEQHYDYLNTLPSSDRESALREEIKKQFGLVAHIETPETDVMFLKIKDAARLQSNLPKNGGTSADLATVAQCVEMYFGKPILDRTGNSAGQYSFNLMDMSLPPSGEARKSAILQGILNKLDQLGLELVPSREKIEMLVVEKVK